MVLLGQEFHVVRVALKELGEKRGDANVFEQL